MNEQDAKICLVAEIAQSHDGSLGLLHSMVDSLSRTGVDVIKFQTHIAEAESSVHEPFRVKFSYVDPTRFDYWKRMEFTPQQWRGIKSHCDESGVEFLCSPFSCAAVDLLEDLGVRRYKIASGEITNHLMIEKIARTGKPIILSTGLSTYRDLDECVSFIKPFGNHVTILQCTTRYPTPAGDVGLNVIAELRERYRVPVGLSDHSGTIYPAIAAATLGAEMIEVHAVFDKMMFGPDSSSSLTMAEVAQLVHGVRFVEEALRNPVNKADDEAFKESKRIFGKSLAVNRDLKAGSVLSNADLEAKKPLGCGVPASEYRSVIGKPLVRDKRRYDFLERGDLE